MDAKIARYSAEDKSSFFSSIQVRFIVFSKFTIMGLSVFLLLCDVNTDGESEKTMKLSVMMSKAKFMAITSTLKTKYHIDR